MPTYKLELVRIKVSDAEVAAIKNAAGAIDYLKANGCFTSESFWRESCYLIALNGSNEPIGYFDVSVGSFDKCYVDIRTIVTVSALSAARSIILSHNHPSGRAKPTVYDIEVTEKLTKALKCLDIQLLDHVILAADEYFSFCGEVVTKKKGLF